MYQFIRNKLSSRNSNYFTHSSHSQFLLNRNSSKNNLHLPQSLHVLVVWKANGSYAQDSVIAFKISLPST